MNVVQDQDSAPDEGPSLPLELLEHIANYTDPHTCLALALVCRALLDRSRRLAFKQIAVHQSYEPERPRLAITTFAALLDSPLCTFKRYTHRLTLPPWRRSEGGLPGLLLNLPNLADLRVEGLEHTPPSRILENCHPFSPAHPALTSLTLEHVRLVRLSSLTSVLVSLPKLLRLELLWTSIGAFFRRDRTREDAVLPITDETLGQLESLRIKIAYSTGNSMQQRLCSWLLALPQFPPIRNLGLTLRDCDLRPSSLLRKFMHRTRLSLAEWTIYPDEYGFSGYDLCDLVFSHYTVLHTFTLDPISLFMVRTQYRHDPGRFRRLLLEVVAAPALRNVVVHLKVDDEYSVLHWEPEQPDWAALDDGLVKCPLLEQVSFVFHLASSHVENELARRAMDESTTAIPQLLPRTNSEGKLRHEQSL